jgi:hypothetical protein
MAKITKPSKPAAKSAAKKPAAKPASAKKPAAKTAVKKPAVKKAAPAKKPAAKPASAKTAVKKPAIKKAAPAKKPAAKAASVNTAAKPAVKKAAPAKKPAAKAAPAPKTAAKPAVKTPAVKAAPVKKAEAVKAPVVKTVQKPPVVAKAAPAVFVFPNLFDAYNTNTLPHDKGLIITSSFRDNSAYTIYEIKAYSGIKELSRNDSELRFSCESAKKFYVLVEPFDYFFKYILDPADRSVSDCIPYRKNELEVFTTVNQTQIMVAKATRDTDPSFAVEKPHSGNLAVVFTKTPDVFKAIAAFFRETFTKDLNIPQVEAEKASQVILAEMEKAIN